MSRRPSLSETITGQAWLDQFKQADQHAAAALLDMMLLLNEEQVSTAIRSLLVNAADARADRRRRIGLYAEREFDEALAFDVQITLDPQGVKRRRAVGFKGPAAVKPIRGGTRIGSEGMIAFLISQAVAASPRVYVNQPGPDHIRGKTRQKKVPPANRKRKRRPKYIGALTIVTDFIGSGTRVSSMLNKFWAVPTVRAWVSRKWVTFKVVAAAGTASGIKAVSNHRSAPEVLVKHIAPTVHTAADDGLRAKWKGLLANYGPETAPGAGREGFQGSAALIAFSYRIPNNTPLIVHRSLDGWRALYTGPAPEELRTAFGLPTVEERIQFGAESAGVKLSEDLATSEAETVLVLSTIRGRWRPGAETAIAEVTGLTIPEVISIHTKSISSGLLDQNGRLTDKGQETVASGLRSERSRPTIPTVEKPYYPQQLRTPREPSSTRRSSGRPR